MSPSTALLLLLFYHACVVPVVRGERSNPVHDRRTPVEIHRIIAIGDVHGDPENFKKILTMSDLAALSTATSREVIWQPKWSSEEVKFSREHGTLLRTTLIQMGDLVDRGEDDLGVLEIASSLFDQVKQRNTRDDVVLLWGNHELLNVQGQFHYVHPESMGGFMSKTLRKRAFALDGEYGRFLLENATVVHRVADTLFVHAGINEDFAQLGVEGLNKETLKAITSKDHRSRLLGSSGPLWTRQMIMEASNDKCSSVEKVLATLGAKRIVVGHTPQRSGHVGVFCDDSVIAIDVGLSRWMYGNLAALELTVTSFKDGVGGVEKDVVMREITASDTHRTESLEESLEDPLLLEELLHAAQEYEKIQASDPVRDEL